MVMIRDGGLREGRGRGSYLLQEDLVGGGKRGRCDVGRQETGTRFEWDPNGGVCGGGAVFVCICS